MGLGKKIYIIASILFIIICIFAINKNSELDIDKEIENMVVLENAEFKEENNGKLVMVKGKVTVEEPACDSKYDITTDNAIVITRDVKEKRYVIDRTYAGQEKVHMDWAVEDSYNSPSVIELNGKKHYNSITPIENSEHFYAKEAYIGDFSFSGEIFEDVGGNPLELSQELIDDINSELGTEYKLGTINDVTDMRTGDILGDYKITFYATTTEDYADGVTIVGMQNGNRIEKYKLSEVSDFMKIYNGDATIEDVKNDLNLEDVGGVFVFLIIVDLIIGIFVFKDDFINLKNKILKKDTKNV